MTVKSSYEQLCNYIAYRIIELYFGTIFLGRQTPIFKIEFLRSSALRVTAGSMMLIAGFQRRTNIKYKSQIQ